MTYLHFVAYETDGNGTEREQLLKRFGADFFHICDGMAVIGYFADNASLKNEVHAILGSRWIAVLPMPDDFSCSVSCPQSCTGRYNDLLTYIQTQENI